MRDGDLDDALQNTSDALCYIATYDRLSPLTCLPRYVFHLRFIYEALRSTTARYANKEDYCLNRHGVPGHGSWSMLAQLQDA